MFGYAHRPARFFTCAFLVVLFGGVRLHAAQEAKPIVVNIDTPVLNDTPVLTVDEVNLILAQGVGFMKANGVSGLIAVVDREGHILAMFRMTQSTGTDFRINEQATVKARTAAFFQSDNNAFTTRTAQFIVQSNFPSGVRNVDAGPLFGVPFSNFPGSDVQLQVPPFIVFINGVNAPAAAGAPALLTTPLGNSNVRPDLQPLVITPLTDDLGGIPIFKNKKAAGAIGVEIDAFGVLAEGKADDGVKRTDIQASKAALEELAAVAASKGFEAPGRIRANKILINGFRFPFTGRAKAKRGAAVPVASLPAEGRFDPYTDTDGTERSAVGTALANAYTGTFTANSTLFTAARATPAQEFPRQGWVPRFPPRDSPLGVITAADVRRMIQQAANTASETKAGIRNPKGTPEQVWISVVDLAGNICGSFRTLDATPFSFDVHVQKARTSAFFSNNQVGFSSRGIGFMAQTLYPPGIDKRPPGPMSGLLSPEEGKDAGALGLVPAGGSAKLTEISQVLVDLVGPSVLNIPAVLAEPTLNGKLSETVQTLAERLPHIRDGRLSPLQVAITVDLTLGRPRAGAAAPRTDIPNGITIFAGGVPIYKAGLLVGGLGVSGGGIDQDDFIAFGGQQGFEPPPGVRCDEANEENVKTALLQAVDKLKLQFPNLTNGSTAVLDVIATRLNSNRVLDDLRLPYVKLPREPVRNR